MKQYDIPARTVMRIKVGSKRPYFKWQRDESYDGPIKTNIAVKGDTLLAVNFTNSPATLSLSV
jgi:hypothetical protein